MSTTLKRPLPPQDQDEQKKLAHDRAVNTAKNDGTADRVATLAALRLDLRYGQQRGHATPISTLYVWIISIAVAFAMAYAPILLDGGPSETDALEASALAAQDAVREARAVAQNHPATSESDQ